MFSQENQFRGFVQQLSVHSKWHVGSKHTAEAQRTLNANISTTDCKQMIQAHKYPVIQSHGVWMSHIFSHALELLTLDNNFDEQFTFILSDWNTYELYPVVLYLVRSSIIRQGVYLAVYLVLSNLYMQLHYQGTAIVRKVISVRNAECSRLSTFKRTFSLKQPSTNTALCRPITPISMANSNSSAPVVPRNDSKWRSCAQFVFMVLALRLDSTHWQSWLDVQRHPGVHIWPSQRHVHL